MPTSPPPAPLVHYYVCLSVGVEVRVVENIKSATDITDSISGRPYVLAQHLNAQILVYKKKLWYIACC